MNIRSLIVLGAMLVSNLYLYHKIVKEQTFQQILTYWSLAFFVNLVIIQMEALTRAQ